MALRFIDRPNIKKLDRRKDPPADINGNGRPFTGIKPTVIAVFTKTCERKIVAKPIKARLENLSFDKNEFLIISLIVSIICERIKERFLWKAKAVPDCAPERCSYYYEVIMYILNT